MGSRWPWIFALAVIGLLVVLWRSAREEDPDLPASPVVGPGHDGGASTARRPARTATITPAPAQTLPAPASFDGSLRHTADPCTALSEPQVPPDFEQITVGSITVAWDPRGPAGPYGTPLRPIVLAHLTAGILEEAAQLTGTDRREQLTVIVHASTADMQQRMRTPSWVGGLYDGGSVHVYARASLDSGVAMQTLRHEIMHAQLHAAAGCTPFWFNEGLAEYFAGAAPMREWFAMLRTDDTFDLKSLYDPNVFDLRDNATRMYAVAFAMVVLLVERGGEQNLRATVRIVQEHNTHRHAVELWERIAPNIDYGAVLESLAQNIFGVPQGPELEAVLRGGICCKQLHVPAEVSCRAAAQGELGVSKGYYCRYRW